MRCRKLPALGVLIAVLAGPISADVLITRDGSRIETQGEWKVDGRQVIFTLPNGTLSAVRASEIDFDASRSATTRASAPAEPPPPPPPPPPPVMVLTNDDIPEVVEGGESSGGPGAPPSPSDREPVQVTSWKPLETTSGLEIRGALVNTAKSTMAANISVRLEVKDEDDEIIGTAVAFLASDTLMPGSSTTFKAALSDVPDFAGEPIFYVESTALTMGGKNFAPGEQASSADDEGDDGDDSDSGDDSDRGGGDGSAGDDSVGDADSDEFLGGGGDGSGFEDGSSPDRENQSSGDGYEDEDEDEQVDSDG